MQVHFSGGPDFILALSLVSTRMTLSAVFQLNPQDQQGLLHIALQHPVFHELESLRNLLGPRAISIVS